MLEKRQEYYIKKLMVVVLHARIVGDFFLLLIFLYFYIKQTFQFKGYLLFNVT